MRVVQKLAFSGILAAITVVASESTHCAEQMPVLHAESLSGKALLMPRDLPASPCVFVVGFSKASRAHTESWSRQLETKLPGDSVTIYSASVIEDVPKLMRRFVVSGIRSGVPERLHDRFLVVSQGARDWQTMAGYTGADTAFVVVVSHEGNILWRAHGPPSDASIRALLDQVAADIATQPPSLHPRGSADTAAAPARR